MYSKQLQLAMCEKLNFCLNEKTLFCVGFAVQFIIKKSFKVYLKCF